MTQNPTEKITKRIMGAENELSEPWATKGYDGNDILKVMAGLKEDAEPFDPQKIILPNQGICYIDGDHLEYATPECLGPTELALFETAGLKILTTMAKRLSRKIKSTFSLHKTNRNCILNKYKVATPDTDNNVWGSHANYLVKAGLDQQDFFYFICPFLLTRWFLIGNGWIEEKEGHLFFSMSQRAGAMEYEGGSQFSNSHKLFYPKSEPHADPELWDRYHDASGNANMSEWQLFLKYAVFDILLAVFEGTNEIEVPEISCMGLANAGRFFNSDMHSKVEITLQEKDAEWSAIDFQKFYLDTAHSFFAGEGRSELTRERKLTLNLWGKITDAASRRDMAYMAQFLDWAAVLHYFIKPLLEENGYNPECIIEDITLCSGRTEKKLSADIKKDANVWEEILQHLEAYACTDISKSHYGTCVRAGLIKKMFPQKLINWATKNSPPHTRAKWRKKVFEEIHALGLDRKCTLNFDWESISLGYDPSNAHINRVDVEIKNLDPYRTELWRTEKDKLKDFADSI